MLDDKHEKSVASGVHDIPKKVMLRNRLLNVLAVAMIAFVIAATCYSVYSFFSMVA